MLRVSLADFSKIPIHQILTFKPLKSSTQSTSSYIFGKTAAEVACERTVKQSLVDYSGTTDDMFSVDMFQMGKGMITGRQVENENSSWDAVNETNKSSDNNTSTTSDMFKEDMSTISLYQPCSSTSFALADSSTFSTLDESTTTKQDMIAEGNQSPPDDENTTKQDVTAEGKLSVKA